MYRKYSLIFVLVVVLGCTPFNSEPRPGPDKQMLGMLYGAAVGAGGGAAAGAQLSSSTGGGAGLGAGFGAIHGMLAGLGVDLLEEDQIQREREAQYIREINWVQETLGEHYERRLELHPNREIFPADLFFESDSGKIRNGAQRLVREIAVLTRRRTPWSRVVIASYVTSSDVESTYGQHVTNSRAEELATEFIRSGIEPRRVLTQGIVVREPVLVDPYDHPDRYRQAIEIIPLDY